MIQARGLTKRYGEVEAARSVSFRVAPGEVVGLLGPNGAGKTTILRMLAGILTPTEGEAEVAGHSASDDPLALKRSLGFLSGDTALYQRLTPREVLRYFGRLNGMDRAALDRRVEELVRSFRMEDFADRQCGKLSAGQKQRANVARAFLHDPPALILDEPTTALDVVTGKFLLDAIRRERGRGKAVLFSTHVLGDAEALCDRVVLLHRGQVLDEGPVPEVIARSGAHTLTDAFLARIGATA
ncbi:MAG TPA: ATP-binding cassette domain-containing protein [Myxococcaceae bacterium]|jgi:sodium transport system ATP-binding protein|nr:ATP-binding cassette domain-containing protein [Myxococcaceae bacterium]